MIVSFSSGAGCFTDKQPGISRMFDKFYDDLEKVEITRGFTIDQASTFLRKLRSPVMLHDIKHISATNLYMLSLVKGIQSNNDPISKVLSYNTRVREKVLEWLNRNFKLLKPVCSNLTKFFC